MNLDYSIFNSNMLCIRELHPLMSEAIESTDVKAEHIAFISEGQTTLQIAGRQLSSLYDPRLEADIQAATLPENESLSLYGCGIGLLPSTLLKRGSLKQLKVKILNLDLFIIVMFYFNQREWLSDPRVQLSLARHDFEVDVPFFCSPAEALFPEVECELIGERLRHELNQKFIDEHFSALKIELQDRMHNALTDASRHQDIKRLFGSQVDKAALIVGAGPSLEGQTKFIESFRHEDRGIILSTDAATKFLSEVQMIPDYVVSIDADYKPEDLFFGNEETVGLVHSPQLQPDILHCWTGPKFIFLTKTGLHEGLDNENQFATLFTGGSVLHPAVDLAIKMGCKTIYLAGADFSFPDGKTHASWANGDLGHRDTETYIQTKSISGEIVSTTQDYLGYKIELERFIARQPQITFYNLSKSGAKIIGALSCHDIPNV